jgi:hypothetical protein
MIQHHPIIVEFAETKAVSRWSVAQLDDLKHHLMARPSITAAIDNLTAGDYDRAIINQCRQHYREWARRKSVIGNHMHNFVLGTNMSEWQHSKRQEWVEAKTRNPNTIVLVQNGRFYEMFHQDADTLHTALNTVYMYGYIAHTGYPISCHDRLVNQLREAGHNSITII